MKIRTGFVSNSSSSSFLLAYDKSFFGDLNRFFNENPIGFDTFVLDEEKKINEMIEDCCSKEEKESTKKKLNELRESGRSICCLELDQEHIELIKLLRQINKANGESHLEILIDTGDI